MTLILIGLLLFGGVHLIPSLAPGIKTNMLMKLGEGGYKGVFSLLLLGGIAAMVLGWRSTLPELVYLPSPEIKLPAIGLILFAFLLIVVAARNSRIKQWIRHPQLTGVFLWSIAHLILNGENRSILLFSGLALWSFLQILAINKREGQWVKSDIPGVASEAVTVLITALVAGLMIWGHPYFAGMPVF